MHLSVIVGNQVVAAFVTPAKAQKFLKKLAPGCNPRIKKSHYSGQRQWLKSRSNETRRTHESLVIETYNPVTHTRKKIRYLLPGDFQV